MQDDELDLDTCLERDQYVAQTSQPVPRVHLGPRAGAALWVLRVFAIVMGLMVIYTFVSQLST